jgi:hypothetical protein
MKSYRFFPIIASLLFISPVSAQEKIENKGVAQNVSNPEEAAIKNRQVMEEMLKQQDSNGYKMYKKQQELGTQMSAVLNKFHDGELTEDQAKTKLYPIVKESMKSELSNIKEQRMVIKEQMKEFDQRLTSLEKAERDPDALVKERVDSFFK